MEVELVYLGVNDNFITDGFSINGVIETINTKLIQKSCRRWGSQQILFLISRYLRIIDGYLLWLVVRRDLF